MRTWRPSALLQLAGSLCGCLAFIAVAQAQSPSNGAPSSTQSPTQAAVPARFVDITEQAGVHFLHQAPHTSRKYLLETMGSGVALFDCDNDGRLDLRSEERRVGKEGR